jgi:SAM-dependent methyltransferase
MERLDRIASGFMEAKVLLAAAELRVFDLLKGAGATSEDLARRIGGDRRGIEILLDALVGMEIVAKEGGVYRNRPEHEPFLVEDSPSHFPSMLRHRNAMFRQWATIEDVVSGRVTPAEHAHRPNLEEGVANENFIRAMVFASRRIAPAVVDRLDLTGVRAFADVGGGPGVYLEEIARRVPAAEPYLVDLPSTLAVSRRVLAGSEVAARIRFVAWDVFADPAPPGMPEFDLVFVSQVVHGEPPEGIRVLFARLFDLTAPGGWLVVHERIVDDGRTAPAESALFAVNMLAMTPGGRVYTEAEIHEWGREAGYSPEPGTRIDDRSYIVRLRKGVRS